jgi:hypothetical protein
MQAQANTGGATCPARPARWIEQYVVFWRLARRPVVDALTQSSLPIIICCLVRTTSSPCDGD